MKHFIEASGLVLIKTYDADTLGEATAQSERIYCVAEENGK